jgi:hypothetical protein
MMTILTMMMTAAMPVMLAALFACWTLASLAVIALLPRRLPTLAVRTPVLSRAMAALAALDVRPPFALRLPAFELWFGTAEAPDFFKFLLCSGGFASWHRRLTIRTSRGGLGSHGRRRGGFCFGLGDGSVFHSG